MSAGRRFTTFLFDLDGTLIDSTLLIMASFRHTMRTHLGTVPDEAAWRAGFGTPLRPQLRKFARDDLHAARMVDTYRTYTNAHHDRLLKSYTGMVGGSFDFAFNKKINRALVFELATARFIAQREDVLLIGPPGTGKSHLAQAIGRAAIEQGYRVIYREAHAFLEELAEATLADTRKAYLVELTRVPLLIIDDLGMRKLPHTAAEDLLELVMRRYERASTMLTSNRPVDDWGKLLGDTAAVTALLDRLLHHAHVLKCGPRSWRTKVQAAAGGRSIDALRHG